MATAIALLQVMQSSGFANTGQKLQRLEQERATLASQNHELEAEVAALSSLDRVERAARERLEMVPAARIEHVSVAIEAPARPLLPRPLAGPSARASEDEPWWRSLLDAVLHP
jgi:cell division protein FtsL